MPHSKDHIIDTELPRRRFLTLAIGLLNGLIALALAVPGVGYLLTPVFRQGSATWVRLGSVGDFGSGRPRKVDFKYVSQSGYSRSEKTRFVWVVADLDESSKVVVFSPTCSHTGCNVAWQDNEQKFVCPCHEGRYDINGEVVSGPPPRPLTKLPVQIRNEEILARLIT